jgi:hypothetical protein
VRESDFKGCYVIEELIGGIKKNNQAKLVLKRYPKIEKIDYKEVDILIKKKKRFVEYTNSLSIEQLPILNVLRYLTSYMDLFDLEFFQAKL